MPVEPANKRRFPRIPAEAAVLVTRLGAETLEEFGKTKVLGLGGCMFVSTTSIGLGARVEILIRVRDRVIRAKARVVWEQSSSNKQYEVGVEFLNVAPADRLTLETLFHEEPARNT